MAAAGTPYWDCPRCQTRNAAYAGICRMCQAPRPAAEPPPTADPPFHVETYAGATADESAREFAADAADMLQEGYEVDSQVWQGSALTVTYRRIVVPTSVTIDRTEVTGGGIAIVVGGAMMAVGSFLPWIAVSTGLGAVSRGGMEGGDGIIIAIAGGVTVLAGIAGLLGSGAWALAIPGALVGGIVGFLDWLNVQDRIRELGGEYVIETGIGLWLILAGAVVAGAGVVMTARASRRKVAA